MLAAPAFLAAFVDQAVGYSAPDHYSQRQRLANHYPAVRQAHYPVARTDLRQQLAFPVVYAYRAASGLAYPVEPCRQGEEAVSAVSHTFRPWQNISPSTPHRVIFFLIISICFLRPQKYSFFRKHQNKNARYGLMGMRGNALQHRETGESNKVTR